MVVNNMGKTKKEHFVPKMYLKRFTYDGNMCYTKNKKGEIHKQNIRDICKWENGYEFRNETGNIIYENWAEKHFSQAERYCDIWLSNLLKHFDTFASTSHIKYFNEISRKDIFSFYAFLLLRHPIVINNTDHFLKNFGINAQKHQARNTGIMNCFDTLEEFAAWMDEHYNIVIHKNLTDIPFIASDTPFCSLKLKDEQEQPFLYMPLSQKYFLICTPRCVTGKMEDVLIHDINLNIQFLNELFSYKDCMKVSISSVKETL